MIADLKPYAEYMESGSPWLGRMPVHWNLRRLGSVLYERRERNEQKQVTQVLSVLKDVGVIRYEDKGNIGNKKSDDIGPYKIVRLDDIVVNCMNVIIGSVGRSRYVGCLSPVYYVLRRHFDEDNPRYLAAIFSAKPFQLSLVRIGNGILSHRMRIPMELLKCEQLPVPPPAEQAAIARFLDYTNGRLERAIRAKRKVIALLNEQKHAVIHHAVTRGLDDSIPLKPSGIPWLGEVPMYWEVTIAKRVCSVFIPQRDKPELNEDEGIPWVTLENVGETFLKPSHFYVRDRDAKAVGSRIVPSGSVLASCVGRFGITSITAGPVVINQQIQAFIPRARLSRFFLRYSVLIAKPYFEMQGNSTTLAYVDREGFETMPLLIPPLPEQEAIVQHLNDATANIDAAISRLEREIELLREYRTRLVADVVTGKLDVREAAARLPEEAAPDTPEDATDGSDETEPADEEAIV